MSVHEDIKIYEVFAATSIVTLYITVKVQNTAARMRVTFDFPPITTCTSQNAPRMQFTPGEWKVGDSFNSFAEFEQQIQAVLDATAVQMYRREGKTLAASMQRYPGRPDKRSRSSAIF